MCQDTDHRSRRPYRQANRLPIQIEKLIVQIKREHPSWGAPKIREKIRRLHADLPLPAISTVHAILDRHELVDHSRQRRYKAEGTHLSVPHQPNDLWCADYKSEFMLAGDALTTTKEQYAFTVFERVFKDFGLPLSIRTDNGVPFSCPNAFFGLSKLSVWWLRLGIGIERIRPGNPQQQGKFDDFIDYFNHQRPHQALGMKYPGALYAPSVRPHQGIGELEYPFHAKTLTVTTCGRICMGNRKINLSIVFAGRNVGVKQVDEKIWLVSFMHYDLGFFDEEVGRVTRVENPFDAKVLPMCPA
jgi:putative transposase